MKLSDKIKLAYMCGPMSGFEARLSKVIDEADKLENLCYGYKTALDYYASKTDDNEIAKTALKASTLE